MATTGLRRSNPVTGARDTHRGEIERADYWTELDGVVLLVEGKGGLYFIGPDLDMIHELMRRNCRLTSDQHSALYKEIRAWIGNDDHRWLWAHTTRIAFRRKNVAAELADLAADPAWPAARDYYADLTRRARGETPKG